MQTEYVYSTVGNRMSPKEWEEAARPMLLDTAIARKEAILAAAECQFAPELDARLREAFKIYV